MTTLTTLTINNVTYSLKVNGKCFSVVVETNNVVESHERDSLCKAMGLYRRLTNG